MTDKPTDAGMELAALKADMAEAGAAWTAYKTESGVQLRAAVDKLDDIAARHRVEVDPLVEAFQRMPATFNAQIWADTARKTFADLGYELAKRGVVIGGAK